MSLENKIVALANAIGTDVRDIRDGKVDKVSGKGLSDTNFTQAEKTKLSGVANGATANRADSENADKLHTHTTAQVTGLDTALETKVDKVAGKGLSSQDYTLAEKQKLASLESSKYRGVYQSLGALVAAVASPTAGDYADIDAGVGHDSLRYIYDGSDAAWIPQESNPAITAAQIKDYYESNANTNAYTDAEKTKLGAIATGATANSTDTQLRARSSHTGTQAISTIAGLEARLDAIANIPSVPKSSAYTATASDKGKSIDTSSGVTFPASVFAVGDVIVVTNTSASNISITPAAGVTFRLAGSDSIGLRTLAGYGVATFRMASNNVWFASGAGLS